MPVCLTVVDMCPLFADTPTGTGILATAYSTQGNMISVHSRHSYCLHSRNHPLLSYVNAGYCHYALQHATNCQNTSHMHVHVHVPVHVPQGSSIKRGRILIGLLEQRRNTSMLCIAKSSNQMRPFPPTTERV